MTYAVENKSLTAVDFFRAKLAFEITPWTLNQKLPEGKHFVLDVRDREKWDLERVPGSANIPLKDLTSRLNELPKDAAIVPYCSNIVCGLAVRAALQLAEKGYAVQLLFGGLEAWKKNHPVAGKAVKPAKKNGKRK